MRYRLENWSVVFLSDNAFLAPELNDKCLRGLRSDGHYCRTSPIRKVQGRLVTTESGNQYELGEIDPKYLEHLQSEGRVVDEKNPIKLVS